MISVIVPCFNVRADQLRAVYESFSKQAQPGCELIFVDDCSTERHYAALPHDPAVRVVYKERNSGPADARNTGAQQAAHAVLFFTDADCRLGPDTLRVALEATAHEHIAAGDTAVEAATLLGRLVAQLGFPGGGAIGFENVWRVDAQGYTGSISSCNLAIRKDAFLRIGCFDPTFPVAGGEDTVFAKAALARGFKIKYVRQQKVYHAEVEGLRQFMAWQITRGRGNYHIKRRLGSVGGFFLLRLWSFKNSLMRAGAWAPAVLALIFLAVVYQAYGYRMEKKKNAATPL